MPVDDRTRLNLHHKLEAVLGPEEADTLMAHLPPVAWQDVATKDDLRTVETTLRSEMHTGFAELRGEIHTGSANLRTEMADLRTEMADLRTEMAGFRTQIAEAMTAQTKWMVTFAAAWSTLLVTAVRLLP